MSNELACILRQLADYIERRPDEELEEILRRAATLTRTAFTRDARRAKAAVSNERIHEIAARLQQLGSREDGEELLRETFANRAGLEVLARYLQLPVQRDDTVDRLRVKIVENTIGSRLRSDAIRGK